MPVDKLKDLARIYNSLQDMDEWTLASSCGSHLLFNHRLPQVSFAVSASPSMRILCEPSTPLSVLVTAVEEGYSTGFSDVMTAFMHRAVVTLATRWAAKTLLSD